MFDLKGRQSQIRYCNYYNYTSIYTILLCILMHASKDSDLCHALPQGCHYN